MHVCMVRRKADFAVAVVAAVAGVILFFSGTFYSS